MKNRTLLKEGVKWLVGNGNQINFWEDSWLMDKPLIKTKFGVLWNQIQDQGGGMVADFISLGRKWKKAELHQNAMVGRELVDELNSMLEEYKILGRDQNDEFIWKVTSTGEFSVKSIYKLMLRKTFEPNDWGKVWFNHLIPKINICWWTTIHGKILTIDNLMKQGFQLPNRCHMCKEEESITHLFLHCNYASNIWERLL